MEFTMAEILDDNALESWEDLKEQVIALDQLYPSAPSGPILEFDDEVVPVYYPSVPIMTMDLQDDNERQSLLNQLTLPSAPLELNIHVSPTLLDSEYQNAIFDEELLDDFEEHSHNHLHNIPIEEEFTDAEKGFKDFLFPKNPDDEFYQKILEYEKSFTKISNVKAKIKSQYSASKSVTSKLWSLTHSPITMKEACPDGWTVTNTYVNEKAVYRQDAENELLNVLHNLKTELYITSPKAIYSSMICECWITNYIDELLWGDFSESISTIQALKTYNQLPNMQFYEKCSTLLPLLDSLFIFERRSYLLGDRFATSLHNWICKIANCINVVGTFEHQRHILFHVLRTPGVGKWGASLVQWRIPDQFDEPFLNNYILFLRALLGPLSELEEVLTPKLLEEREQIELMKNLEDEQWIVIEDAIFQPFSSTVPKPISLSPDDFQIIFQQFGVTTVFQSTIQNFDHLVKGLNQNSSDYGNAVMKLFSIGHRLFIILARALTILPLHFDAIRLPIAVTIVDLIVILMSWDIPTDTPINFIRKNDLMVTTVAKEQTKFIIQVLKLFFSKSAKGLGKYSAYLPFQKMSSSGRRRLIQLILSGIMFENISYLSESEKNDKFVEVILRDTNDIYLFDLLKNILICNGSNEIDGESGQSIVAFGFKVGLVHADIQRLSIESTKSILAVTCASSPKLLSLLLKLTQEHFESVKNIIQDVFESLPLNRWAPTKDDFEILEEFLKDPIKSQKSYFARFVIDSLSWKKRTPEGESFIPLANHHQLGITIVNIHLDHIGRLLTQGLISATSKAAIKSVKTIANTLQDRFPDHDERFKTWCWFTMKKLDLYSRPSAKYSYYSANSQKAEIPYIPWEDSSLATLRGQSQSQPMAAYAIMMISEVGHRYDLFDTHGWVILGTLLENGYVEALLRTSYEVFRTFTISRTMDIMKTDAFQKLFNGCFSYATTTELELAHSFLADTLTKAISKSQVDEIKYSISFWCSIVFSNPNWFTNVKCVEMVDVMSRVLYSNKGAYFLLQELNTEYRKLVFTSNGSHSPNALQVATISPLSTIYKFASQQLYEKIGFTSPSYFPSLIQDSLSVIANSQNDFSYFYFMALSAEMFAEKDLRSRVGILLGQGGSLKAIQMECDKPLSSFSIFRFVDYILHYPLDHPLLILYLQSFFNLYFESGFGHLFLNQKSNIVQLLSKKLGDPTLANLTDLQRIQLLNAMSLWLTEPRLLLPNINISTFGESYCVGYLERCLKGEIFELGSTAWWYSFDVSDLETHGETDVQFTEDFKPVEFAALTSTLLPLKVPQIVFTLPYLQELSSLSTNELIPLINQELLTLEQQAKQHSAYIQHHSQRDEQYLECLKNLYVNSTKTQSLIKKCCSTCPGVQFNFVKESNSLDSESANLSKTNRKEVEGLLNLDMVDSRTAMVGLKILRIVENLCITDQEANDASISLFYHIVDLLIKKLNAFPPADILFGVVVQKLGSKFIKTNNEETRKLFQLIKKKKQVALLSNFYDPSLLNEEFVAHYRDLRLVFLKDDANEIISTFNVEQWIKLQNPSVNTKETLLDEILSSCSASTNSDSVHELHLSMLGELLKYDDNSRIPKNISTVMAYMIRKDPHSNFLNVAQRVYLEHDVGEPFPTTWSYTTVTSLSKQLILEIMAHITRTFTSQLVEDPDSYFQALSETFTHLLRFLTVMFSSNVLYLHKSEFNFFEVWNALLYVYLPLVGISNEKPIADGQTACSNHVYTEILKSFIFLTEKMCQLFDCKPQLAPCIWTFFDTILVGGTRELLDVFYVTSGHIHWKSFVLNDESLNDIHRWIQYKRIDVNCLKYLSTVILNAKLDFSGDFSGVQLIEILLYFTSNIEWIVDVKDRYDLLQRCFEFGRKKGFTLQEVNAGIKSLPKHWNTQLKSIVLNIEDVTCFPATIELLRVILAKLSDSSTDILSKYLIDILGQQTVIQNPLEIRQKAFLDTEVGKILCEILILAEDNCPNDMLLIVQNAMSLINHSAKEDKVNRRLMMGLLSAIDKSQFPERYLSHACKFIASSEEMAIVCESSITRYLKLTSSTDIWGNIQEILHIPELEEATFIRHCLTHCLIYTLYVYSLQRLHSATGNSELKIMIGEQLGVWIESLKLESLKNGDDSKVVLLFLQFSDLLQFEYQSVVVERHSRLRAHLFPISDTLFKWSEAKGPMLSLWSALGFGTTSVLSKEFRFFCRTVGTFMATRLLTEDQTSEHTKLIEGIEQLYLLPEYSEFKPLVSRCRLILKDKSKTSKHLKDLVNIQMAALFPNLMVVKNN
ncbi:hypothetical protein BC833DRAFT_575226 [Globomyces pollinis-pini]|nr:hypothetical protein BC833DRAFT_575226 [Globomyces pollinis-pini]